MNKKRKSLFIFLVLIIILACVGLKIYNLSNFRIVKTTPSVNKSIASSTRILLIEFNRELDKNKINDNSIESNGLVRKLEVNKNTIKLHLNALESKINYPILIKSVYSINGEKIENKKIVLKSKYIEAKKLNIDEVNQQVEATDPKSSLGTVLPYDGSMYYISVNSNQSDPILINIIMNFSVSEEYYDNPKYLEDVRKYRTEAFEYLKSKGIKINDYEFTYSEPVLLDEFPKDVYRNDSAHQGD